jgi:hypothetical protein
MMHSVALRLRTRRSLCSIRKPCSATARRATPIKRESPSILIFGISISNPVGASGGNMRNLQKENESPHLSRKQVSSGRKRSPPGTKVMLNAVLTLDSRPHRSYLQPQLLALI